MDTALGLARKTVRLVPYDACWMRAFELEASLLRQHLAPEIGAIEHIGSTAITGMEAKPIIDMMVELPCLRAPEAFYRALDALGYEHRPADGVPDRIFFAKGLREQRTHHLSACELESSFWRDHLAFRDTLRHDSSLATSYVQLKRELASQFPKDRDAYTRGKEAFFIHVLTASHGA